MRISLLVLVVSTLTLSARDKPAPDASLPDAPPVVLTPFTVQAEWFQISFLWNREERLAEAWVKQVTPNSPAARVGVRVRDELIAIDMKKLKGMSREEVSQAFNRHHEPGRPQVFTFLGERGLLKKEKVLLNLAVAAKEDKPSASPTPTPTATP